MADATNPASNPTPGRTPGRWHTGTDEDAHVVYDEDCGFVADTGRDDCDEGQEVANATFIADATKTVGRCGDCKHWTDEEGDGFGTCLRVLHGYKRDETTIAYVQDKECYDATLYTKADFGCVLFEPKEEAS